MATGTAGSSARWLPQQMAMFLCKPVAFSAGASAVVTLGVIPAGSIIISAGVIVSTAYNAGSTNVMDIGTAADDDGFGTDLALGTIGNIVWDELATSNDLYVTADTTIIATLALTGTAATAGQAFPYILFMPTTTG